MTQALAALLGLAAGFVAGLAYFATLWRAVRQVTAGAGAARLAGGMLLRVTTVAALAAAALAAGAPPVALLSGAAGFLAARILATRLARPDGTGER